MSGISSFIFVSVLYLDNKSVVVVLVCTVFWCFTAVSLAYFFEAYVIGLQHLSWILLPVVCGLWSYLLHRQSNSSGIFVGHVVCLVLLFLCFCSGSLHLPGFCIANAIGHNAGVLGASFLGNCIPSNTYRRLAPRPSYDTSISRCVIVECHGYILLCYLLCPFICIWYVLFHVYLDLVTSVF